MEHFAVTRMKRSSYSTFSIKINCPIVKMECTMQWSCFDGQWNCIVPWYYGFLWIFLQAILLGLQKGNLIFCFFCVANEISSFSRTIGRQGVFRLKTSQQRPINRLLMCSNRNQIWRQQKLTILKIKTHHRPFGYFRNFIV